MLEPITERQKSVLIMIIQRELSGGGSYTIKELADVFAMKSANGIQDHVGALRKKGYLEMPNKGKSRSIVVSREFMIQAAQRGIPLINAVTLAAATVEDLIGLKLALEEECSRRDFRLNGLPIRRTTQTHSGGIDYNLRKNSQIQPEYSNTADEGVLLIGGYGHSSFEEEITN